MTSIPRRCAERRANFIELATTRSHLRFLDGVIMSSRRAGDNLVPYEYDGARLADDMVRFMRMAEMWTGTPDMLDLISHAAKSLPPQALHREQLPSQHGFLYLPRPLLMTDVRGVTLPVHGILWTEQTIGREGEVPGHGVPAVARGVILFLFTETGSAEDPMVGMFSRDKMARLMADAPQMSLVHTSSVAFGHIPWSLDSSHIDASPEVRARIARQAMRSSHDAREYRDRGDGTWDVITGEGHHVIARPEATTQFLQAYFSFVASELSGLDREFLPRSSASWLRRLELPNDPISVVRLRRRASGPDRGKSHGSLTYRHVRRGHWRRQWCGSDRDGSRRQEHRWIAPTIVGPEDGELRVRDVVNLAQM